MRHDHDLKIWTEPFCALWLGHKTHEVRKADRNFRRWDVLLLREWSAKEEQYTGRWIRAEVTYITAGGEFGLPSDVVVMSVRKIDADTGKVWR